MEYVNYIKDPEAIEKKSFEIIRSRIDARRFSDGELAVVQRVIHATADFDYEEILEFSPDAVEKGLAALKAGCGIVTDTRMAQAGINRRALEALGCRILCYVDDPEAVAIARERGITRSMAAMELASKDPKNLIFAIGNAPTALFKLAELIQEGKVRPSLVVGVPVGFVGAAESKETLFRLRVPSIITRGRKGGTTVAVSIVNALLYALVKEGPCGG
ncbi:precorrin-8X methylmutase [Thermosediminibacter oceani]|uniref:Precorrin-8X methylmutase n=1 Tax=Thermosediminibacter oceani (strain ATCC BAA-1034 / DSM 16646 / JW/IW-1228P) TaxID=555079 RepID=D9S0S7_THEOJ|nr:precorrin-8X methylmutase [Thermosediminibacter oceani]ADL07091.1 precorrin-8X methylmutase [Thermosediminibacter oceani DSM 16646]